MPRSWKLRVWPVILCSLLWVTGFSMNADPEGADDQAEIRRMFSRMQQAINSGNLAAYLSSVDDRLPFYAAEQKRWFQDAVRFVDPGSFRVDVLNMERVGEAEWKVDVRRSWTRKGKPAGHTGPLMVRKTSEGWKHADFPFVTSNHGPVTIRMEDASLERYARIAKDVLTNALRAFGDRYDWNPRRVEVKLYRQPEHFRHSVKLSLPEWAGGWHEANQSIKLVVGTPGDEKWFARALVHELTHQMVSELTNDNAAYWLQEGAAMYYEVHLLPELKASHGLKLLEKTGAMSLEELKRVRLESLEGLDAYRYYLSAYAWFREETDNRGEQNWKRVFSRLKKHPYLDVDGDLKIPRTNLLTEEALHEADKPKQPERRAG
ncbi:peptidase MA family metallohydrolase [Staphylospora marina]|uniref:peptidase MA family metallohydrolase n=1 Tax=Staphylospora marina TaxID=2490858 RepID=UPI000F5C2185|nr:hypothetical protein [Staphylospora marina]